jgi:predicted N-formylglutamate amidohydrolase
MGRRRPTTPSALMPLLVGPDDPPPVDFIESGAAPVLLTCDHASNAVPRTLQGLGLARQAIAQHIGWDIGAAAVTRRLAAALDAPAVLSGYSRLVIDCNRDPSDPSSIPETSDGVAIPGNRNLSPEARDARRQACFEPYHARIAAWIAASATAVRAPALLSIHSFTPTMQGRARPWHVGILWNEDPRIPVPLLAALRAEPGVVVGDNEPYSAREPAGYTIRHHAEAGGLPHVAIELRQDLVASAAGAAEWAARLRAALAPILARPELYRALPPAL